MGGIKERSLVVKPFVNRGIFSLIKLHLDRLQGLDIFDILRPRKRWLFVIERREPHSLEMSPVTLLSPHAHPHGSPLGMKDGLDDSRRLVHQCKTPIHVV